MTVMLGKSLAVAGLFAGQVAAGREVKLSSCQNTVGV
jgi:hypothetical protein